MRVIKIDEETHGFIGLAKDCASAIRFLYDENWLTEDTEIWDDEEQIWRPLKELCEMEEILSLDLESFNRVFECVFLLEEVKVYE